MSDHIRLDASDADLVDVIHTDASSIVLLGECIFETISGPENRKDPSPDSQF